MSFSPVRNFRPENKTDIKITRRTVGSIPPITLTENGISRGIESPYQTSTREGLRSLEGRGGEGVEAMVDVSFTENPQTNALEAN